MNNVAYLLLATAVMFLVTFFLRGFPFIVFGKGRPIPKIILYIGRVIGPAMIAVLIIYCLKDIRFTAPMYGGAELIAIAICILLHKAMHNSLLSIIGSTAIYMYLVQTFA